MSQNRKIDIVNDHINKFYKKNTDEHKLKQIWVPEDIYDALQIEITGELSPYPRYSKLNKLTILFGKIEIIPYDNVVHAVFKVPYTQAILLNHKDFDGVEVEKNNAPLKSLFIKDEE